MSESPQEQHLIDAIHTLCETTVIEDDVVLRMARRHRVVIVTCDALCNLMVSDSLDCPRCDGTGKIALGLGMSWEAFCRLSVGEALKRTCYPPRESHDCPWCWGTGRQAISAILGTVGCSTDDEETANDTHLAEYADDDEAEWSEGHEATDQEQTS